MMIKVITAASVIAVAGAVLVATPANAAKGNFGGIAYSPGDGVYAWVNHVDSWDAAVDGSVAQCETKKGTECRWAAADDNNCLVLLADEDGQWAGGVGATIKQAIKDAHALAKKNDYTIDTDTPLTSVCTWDKGPDQG